MDSQRTVDHLRDEANVRKDTTLGNLLDTAAEELDEAQAALDTIAGGMTNEFPGAPDIMAMGAAEFRGAMWTWSQAVAKSVRSNNA